MTEKLDPSDPARLAALEPLDVHGQWPWSVLHTDAKHWQTRKTWWRGQIDDLAGRENVEIFRHGVSGRHHRISGGKSRFDGFLTELLYTWYSPAGGHVLDPFAGGPTRGTIAHLLGRTYHGWDLSQAQIDANRAQAARHPDIEPPVWEHGDGITGLRSHPETADFVLTCPPYHNVEKYTDHPQDLSAMTWPDHLAAVQAAWDAIATALKPDRFAAWVTGDLRNPSTGQARLLPERTALAAENAGLKVINTHIISQPVGTKYRMIRRWWENTRSCGRTHQTVIIAVKGDRRKAVEAIRDAAH